MRRRQADEPKRNMHDRNETTLQRSANNAKSSRLDPLPARRMRNPREKKAPGVEATAHAQWCFQKNRASIEVRGEEVTVSLSACPGRIAQRRVSFFKGRKRGRNLAF